MIRHTTYIKRYDLVVYSYFKKTCLNSDEILDRLYSIGADGVMLSNAAENLEACSLDTGLTYYNPRTRAAVMVVSETSDAAQTFNSLIHELWHLIAYVAMDLRLSPYEEPIAYLAGDVACDMFSKISKLLCDCCRTHKHLGV